MYNYAIHSDLLFFWGNSDLCGFYAIMCYRSLTLTFPKNSFGGRPGSTIDPVPRMRCGLHHWPEVSVASENICLWLPFHCSHIKRHNIKTNNSSHIDRDVNIVPWTCSCIQASVTVRFCLTEHVAWLAEGGRVTVLRASLSYILHLTLRDVGHMTQGRVCLLFILRIDNVRHRSRWVCF